MKKILLTLTILFVVGHLPAQVITDSTAYLDINQVKALIGSGGMNFCKLPAYTAAYEYPASSGHTTIFSSTLWIGGKSNDSLYLAAERYRQNGRDYNPGPVMDTNFYTAELPNWNKVWKINKADIDYHIAHWSDGGYTVPASIANWPAMGNTAHGMNYFQAPFQDVDSDFFYNPAAGDYPLIRGDQAIYFIFNDSARGHFDSGGKCMGVEVHGMAYAYNSNPELQKAVFVNYLFYNRSNRTYDSLYIGNFTDVDLGYCCDDFVGCDSSLSTFYVYNGQLTDAQYGSNPPVQTITMLGKPMTSFVYFNNAMPGWTAAMTDPSNAKEYYSYMKGFWKDGKHFIYGGNGYPNAPEDTILTNYMFPGYPNDSLQWNEVNAGDAPSDRRGLGVSGPYTLAPGDYISFDLVFITVDSGFSKSTSFPNIDNMLGVVADFQNYFDSTYNNNGNDIALGIHNNQTNNNYALQCKIYPNPVSNLLTIELDGNTKKSNFEILNSMGQTVYQGNIVNKTIVSTNNFPSGFYIIKLENGQTYAIKKLIKQ